MTIRRLCFQNFDQSFISACAAVTSVVVGLKRLLKNVRHNPEHHELGIDKQNVFDWGVAGCKAPSVSSLTYLCLSGSTALQANRD